MAYYHTALQLYLLVATVIPFWCALLRLGWRKIRSTLVLFSINCLFMFGEAVYFHGQIDRAEALEGFCLSAVGSEGAVFY